jgi:hypothetical protein
MFLTDGRYFAIRPEMYAGWHFAALILGVFSGLFDSIKRWIMGFVYFSAMFPRLDISIYPTNMVGSDLSHRGFHQVLIAESKNNNPLMLLFASFLFMGDQIRKSEETRSGSMIKISTFGARELHFVSPTVLNLCRIWLSTMPKKNPSDPDVATPHVLHISQKGLKFDRIQHRWWLLWILHSNPSFRRLRKHKLYHPDESDAFLEVTSSPQEKGPAPGPQDMASFTPLKPLSSPPVSGGGSGSGRPAVSTTGSVNSRPMPAPRNAQYEDDLL